MRVFEPARAGLYLSIKALSTSKLWYFCYKIVLCFHGDLTELKSDLVETGGREDLVVPG